MKRYKISLMTKEEKEDFERKKIAKRREYERRRRGTRNDYHKEYYQKNKSRVRRRQNIYFKEWYAQNKEKLSEIRKKHRRRIKNDK